MLRHIVWWTFKPEAKGHTDIENIKIMKERCEALIGKIPSLLSIELSTQFEASTTQTAQLILMSTHDDMAGLKAYGEHPEHASLLAFVKAVAETRQAIDYYF